MAVRIVVKVLLQCGGYKSQLTPCDRPQLSTMLKRIAWPPALKIGSPSPFLLLLQKCTSAWMFVIHKTVGGKTALGILASSDHNPLTGGPLGCLAEPEKPWVRSLTLLNGDYREEQGCLNHHISGLTCCEVGSYNVNFCFLPGQNIHASPHLLFVLSNWGYAMTNWTMPASSCRLKMSSLHLYCVLLLVTLLYLIVK